MLYVVVSAWPTEFQYFCYISIAQLMHRDHNITQKLENA